MNRPKFIDCFPKYSHRDKNQMEYQLVAYMNYCDRLEQYCDELEATSKTGKSKEMSIDGKPLYTKEEAFAHLTKDMQETIINKKIKFYNIDAEKLIKSQPGLRGKGANTVMMVAYFKVSGIIPFEQAVFVTGKLFDFDFIKESIIF